MQYTYPNSQALLSAFYVAEAPLGIPSYPEVSLHIGKPKEAISYLKNVNWAFTEDDTRFLAHDLHPYPAKFIPQLPGTLISLLSSRGELVFDPFGGSGTTALEAIRLGRRAISLDANPVAGLIGRVKTARINNETSAELHLLHGALRALLNDLPEDPAVFAKKYLGYAPVIANREKWFPDSSFGELAHIRFRINKMGSEAAKEIALLALSRTVLPVSFQDSETRYKSVPRKIPVGEATSRYVREFEAVMRSVARNASATRYGISKFITADARQLPLLDFPDDSVDLVVTSPPYGNAMDYHLYHRFRLLWLGHDPISFGKVEIGSHLKHQREESGFESYLGDMLITLKEIHRVLKSGRYAALVIGDSVYESKKFDTAQLLEEKASSLGFDHANAIEREVHRTKRSFTPAGRRATTESILILRKLEADTRVKLHVPPYRLWPYESLLRKGEGAPTDEKKLLNLNVSQLIKSRTMVFTHKISNESGYSEPTWQAILENGMASNPSARKDPKYVTHGLHPYKGKFYPQLAKGLINQLNLPHGSKILDPFCGSGTTLLEGYLNGYTTFGCDVHPLAAQIARAKVSILEQEPDIVAEVISGILSAIDSAPKSFPKSLDQFEEVCHEEIKKWFAQPVSHKLNWLLHTIRIGSAGPIRDFLESVLSSIIRSVSQQDPTDLRIRYRDPLLKNAPVLEEFSEQLSSQYARLEKFWKVRGYAPNPFFPSRVIAGDNRDKSTFDKLGLTSESIDLVLTSPPYAMALPYIDTDRLSLLTLMSLGGAQRRPIEQMLTGSREITGCEKKRHESDFLSDSKLPKKCGLFLKELYTKVEKSKEAGFRKQNMPALMNRFLSDMDSVLREIFRVCKHGAEAMIVIGDSRMTIDDKEIRIPTTELIESIAIARGFKTNGHISISVTTENLIHLKNAIKENAVLRFQKPG